ncbi:MAG: hypothetical protein U0V48_03655 [Anaerolineales bacterium]
MPEQQVWIGVTADGGLAHGGRKRAEALRQRRAALARQSWDNGHHLFCREIWSRRRSCRAHRPQAEKLSQVRCSTKSRR